MLGVRKRVMVRISEVLKLSLWEGGFISWLKMAEYWRGHAYTVPENNSQFNRKIFKLEI